jgi:hypothetical protein
MKNEAIEMIKTPLSVVRVAAFCLPLALVASCGSGDSESIQSTTINIDPIEVAETTLDIESIDSLGDAQVFRIEARSPSGYSQVGVQILLRSGFTVYEGHPNVTCVVTQAYDNTVTPVLRAITTCTAPGATPLDLSQPVTTGPNGAYEVTVVYSISPRITGDIGLIEAFSGTGYNSAKAVVKCGDADAATGDSCL